MNTIIIYATKYGCAEKAARLLRAGLDGEVSLVNVMKEAVPALDPYDCVVLGGSIYMGKMQKQLKSYVSDKLPLLLKKRVGLFICAGLPQPEARKAELEGSFPPELYKHAICKEVFGHEMDYERMSFLDRTIMRAVTGSKESSFSLSEEKIEDFAKVLRT